MSDGREHDLVLVGNGAVACAIALRFAAEHPDARVAIVGPSARPGAASLAAGAMLGVFGELGEGALASAPARRKFEAALAATALWPEHLELLNSRLTAGAPVRIVEGTVIVSRSEEEEEDVDGPAASAAGPDPDFQVVLDELARYGVAHREVDPRQLAGLAPPPRGRPRRAVLVPQEGAVASRALHLAYDEAFARARNVAALDGEVIAIEPSGHPERAATSLTLTTGARLRARHVVLAAGAATQPLVEALGLAARVPRLVHGVGVSLILDSTAPLPRQVVRTPNRGLVGGLYSVPYPAPFAYIGATSALQLRPEPPAASSGAPSSAPSGVTSAATSAAIAALRYAARHHLHQDLAGARLHKVLVGSRPTPLDTYPLFGQTSLPGIWLATGTKRDGLHLSPLLARELVRALAGGPPPLGGAFAPERELLLPAADRAAAVERAVTARLRAARAAARRAADATDVNGAPSPAALDADAQRAAVAALYDRCARAGLMAADRELPVELLPIFDALASS